MRIYQVEVVIWSVDISRDHTQPVGQVVSDEKRFPPQRNKFHGSLTLSDSIELGIPSYVCYMHIPHSKSAVALGLDNKKSSKDR